MKAAVAFSAIFLLACLCRVNAVGPALQVPGPDGKIRTCKELPAGLKNRCVKYSCDKTGSVSVLGCSLVNIRCKDGQVLDKGKKDLTKVYPKCCPRPSCRTV